MKFIPFTHWAPRPLWPLLIKSFDHLLSNPTRSLQVLDLSGVLLHELASSLIGFNSFKVMFPLFCKVSYLPVRLPTSRFFLAFSRWLSFHLPFFFSSYTLSEFLNFFTVILEESGRDLRKSTRVSSAILKQMSFQVVCTWVFFIHLFSSVVLLVCLCECFLVFVWLFLASYISVCWLWLGYWLG